MITSSPSPRDQDHGRGRNRSSGNGNGHNSNPTLTATDLLTPNLDRPTSPDGTRPDFVPDRPWSVTPGVGSVRRGRSRILPPHAYEPVQVLDLGIALTEAIAGAENIQSVFSLLDPDRVARIHGITAHGEFDGSKVAAYGEKVFSNGALGVDLLVVPPYSGFPPHVHPGHHLLLCIGGPGTFAVNAETYPVAYGELHMIEGGVPHAVGNPNPTPHILLAFGCPPKELDAPDRMRVVDWEGRSVHVPVDS